MGVKPLYHVLSRLKLPGIDPTSPGGWAKALHSYVCNSLAVAVHSVAVGSPPEQPVQNQVRRMRMTRKWSIFAGLCALAISAMCTLSASGQSEVKEKPPMYSYI